MPLTREQKQKVIEALKEDIAKQKAMIFVDFGGLKTKDLSGLKNDLKEVNSVLRVCKKTLLNLALLNSAKGNLTGLALKAEKLALEVKDIKGQLAVVFCLEEEVAPAKAVYQFSQGDENLKILGCFLGGQLQDKDYLIALAQLPTREELLAKLVSGLAAPISNFVNVLQANIKGLIYVLTKVKT